MTGHELKTLRINLGLTQKQMAEKLGITASLVSKLEGGDKMNNSVRLLAEQLKLSK